jgi:hypothetical protein
MLLVYGDESMDETQQRVCAAGAVVGTEEEWSALQGKWVERTRGVPFHANDCESNQGVYAPKPGEYLDNKNRENKALYRDLTVVLAESGLCGFGSAIDLRAQSRFIPDFPRHQTYYKVVLDVIEFMKNMARDKSDVAEITFDSRTESEFNAALVYANMREENPEWRDHLASKISFESSISNPRVQVGDLFAREAMKALDNEIGPVKRAIRKSWKALRDTERFVVFSYSEAWFQDLLADLPNLIQSSGFTRSDYEVWIQERNRQDNLTAYLEFFHWHQLRTGRRAP